MTSESLLKSVIVDDEPLAHRVIMTYCREIPMVKIIGQFYKGKEALDFINSQEVDLIFLDIRMPEFTGLDLLKSLSVPVQVIVTSAHREYALDGFEWQVCDYLLKPFRFERFAKAVSRASKAAHTPDHYNNQSGTFSVSAPVYIRSERRLHRIQAHDIYYLEAYGNYVKVWLKDKYLLAARTLRTFYKELGSESFTQVHKSFVVHNNKINFIKGSKITLQNGSQIPIGKKFKNNIPHSLES